MSVETGATFFLSHLYFLFVKAKYKERGTVLAEDQIVQVSFCEFCPRSETIVRKLNHELCDYLFSLLC